MLRSALSAVSRRTRRVIQISLDENVNTITGLRQEKAITSSALQASQEQKNVQQSDAKPIGTAAATAAQQQGLGAAPGIAKALGFAGALPFVALSPAAATTLPLWFVDPALVTYSGVLQIGYGATILSFLGGVHWGVAMTNIGGVVGAKLAQERYLWSVLPCLMAWPTLLMPVTHAAGVQAALLGVVYSVDRSWAKRGLLPPWYMSLRTPLTLLAAAGLLATATLEVPPGVHAGLASS